MFSSCLHMPPISFCPTCKKRCQLFSWTLCCLVNQWSVLWFIPCTTWLAGNLICIIYVCVLVTQVSLDIFPRLVSGTQNFWLVCVQLSFCGCCCCCSSSARKMHENSRKCTKNKLKFVCQTKKLKWEEGAVEQTREPHVVSIKFHGRLSLMKS